MDEPGGQPFGLAPINLADKPLFNQAFSALSQPVTDYSFTANFMWSASLGMTRAVIHRHLCVFANGCDLTMLVPPMPLPGATDADLRAAVDACFEHMDRYNEKHSGRSHSRIEYVSDEVLERFSATPGLSLSAAPMSGDYVYDMQRMIDLAGGSLKSKRHGRSRFMREHPGYRTEPLTRRHVPACLALLETWRHHGDQTHEGEVNEEHVGSDVLRHRDELASRRALEHFVELGLTGMTLLVGDTLVGFTLGEQLAPTQASVLIEKTHPGYHGSAQFIFSEFCRQHWGHLPECNAGDDWGIPSLRFTKQSYRPMRLLSKYVLTRQPVHVVQGLSPMDVPAQNRPHLGPIPEPVSKALAAEPAVAVAPPREPELIELRAATLADADAIIDLERRCFSTVEETFNKRQVRALVTNPRATVTVALVNGCVSGWSVGLVRQHRKTRSGRLYAVAVSPDARGRQLGRRLAEHTTEALAGLGITRVFLEVRTDNQPALALYRKLGFRDHKFLPNYYGPGRHGLRMKRPESLPTLFTMTADQTATA